MTRANFNMMYFGLYFIENLAIARSFAPSTPSIDTPGEFTFSTLMVAENEKYHLRLCNLLRMAGIRHANKTSGPYTDEVKSDLYVVVVTNGDRALITKLVKSYEKLTTIFIFHSESKSFDQLMSHFQRKGIAHMNSNQGSRLLHAIIRDKLNI